jgi:hypothetical protein
MTGIGDVFYANLKFVTCNKSHLQNSIGHSSIELSARFDPLVISIHEDASAILFFHHHHHHHWEHYITTTIPSLAIIIAKQHDHQERHHHIIVTRPIHHGRDHGK